MNNIKVDAVLGFESVSKGGARKYGVRVFTKGVWLVMARKGSKEPNEVLMFKRAGDRDRYMVMLMATYGPAVHKEREKMKKRIARERLK